jgi:hypothetical protein
LRVPKTGAQRASSSRAVRLTVLAIGLTLIGAIGAADPTPVAAASMKVVVVVGPVGSSTKNYKKNARRYADKARSYGAHVVEVYSPNASWKKVKAAAKGANILIYLGHGNGSPSPYGAFSKDSKDGMGLNRSAGHGNNNTRYRGESYIEHGLDLAPHAVVILNRLCYASGNSEWGRANPTKATAKKRVDNYGAGFLRAGAAAVFAEGITNASYILDDLFRSNKTMAEIFRGSTEFEGAHDFTFASKRTPGMKAWMAPYKPHRYYRSVVGKLDVTASKVRSS